MTGTLLESRADSFWVRTAESYRLGLSRFEVRRIEVRDGRRHNAGIGAMVGMGVGVALGALVAIARNDETEVPRELLAMLIIGHMGLAGAGAGAFIGLVAQEDRWVEWIAGFDPSTRRLRFGARLSL